MASGTICRRTTPAGASSWVVHATWRESGSRRQLTRSFRTKRETQGELTRFLAAHQSGGFVAPSRTTLSDGLEPWLAALANQGRKPTTSRGDRRVFTNHVLPRLGGTPLQELRAADLDALRADLLRSGRRGGGGLAMTSVDHVHAALNKLLSPADVPVIRLHDLRHTHASHLLRVGVNVKVVSDRLGPRIGELHARHLRPCHAGPTSRSGGRRRRPAGRRHAVSDREELRLRLRSEESPPPTANVVFRGGPDTPSPLQTHAKRLPLLYERARPLAGQPVRSQLTGGTVAHIDIA